MELARRIGAIKEGSVQMSDFLEVRSMVIRFETEIAGLRHARLDTPSPTLSRVPAESSRLPVPIYSGNHSILPILLKLFRTWILAHDAENAIVTSEPIRVVGKHRVYLDNAYEKQKVNQSIAVWTGVVRGIEWDNDLLNMVVTAGSPSEAWKIVLSMVGDGGTDLHDRKLFDQGLRRQSESFRDETRTTQC